MATICIWHVFWNGKKIHNYPSTTRRRLGVKRLRKVSFDSMIWCGYIYVRHVCLKVTSTLKRHLYFFLKVFTSECGGALEWQPHPGCNLQPASRGYLGACPICLGWAPPSMEGPHTGWVGWDKTDGSGVVAIRTSQRLKPPIICGIKYKMTSFMMEV